MISRQCSKHVEAYNKLIIKQEFVHYVGQLLKLYWDARSAKHQNNHQHHSHHHHHYHRKWMTTVRVWDRVQISVTNSRLFIIWSVQICARENWLSHIYITSLVTVKWCCHLRQINSVCGVSCQGLTSDQIPIALAWNSVPYQFALSWKVVTVECLVF